MMVEIVAVIIFFGLGYILTTLNDIKQEKNEENNED